MATFPNFTTITPDLFPGQCAGARKPSSSKGFIVTNAVPATLVGVTIGNFCYQVADTQDQVVQGNTSATSPNITGGTTLDTAANIAAYTTPTLNFGLNGTPYTVGVTFATGDTYANIATKLQAAILAAIAPSGNTTFTVTYATNKFVLDTGQKGGNFTLTQGTATQLATGLALTPQTGAVVTAGNNGLMLAGLVTRTGTYVSTDIGSILYEPGYSNVVSAGQNVDVAERGSWGALITGILGGGTTAPMFSYVYSRDTDGAVFLGNTATTSYAGYTRTNFVTTYPAASNVATNVVRIANDERVI